MEKCMTIPRQWENLVGLTAVDAEGNQIGKVGEVYLNRVSGQPEWVTVSTGMSGNRSPVTRRSNRSIRSNSSAFLPESA